MGKGPSLRKGLLEDVAFDNKSPKVSPMAQYYSLLRIFGSHKSFMPAPFYNDQLRPAVFIQDKKENLVQSSKASFFALNPRTD